MDVNKSDFLKQCQSAFGQQMAALMPIWPEDHIAVAVSGGADSLALLFLLDQWCKSQATDLSLIALTVDHQLRPESAQEALQVAKWAYSHNIDHHILTWNQQDNINSANIQMRARQARYDLLFSFCQGQQIPHLFLAHHQQDQAETVMQRIARGTGINGLSAMADISWQQQIRLCRPLLGWSKQSLMRYLSDKGQPWIEDPSNDKQQYDRVKWRHFMPDLAEQGLTDARITQLADHARRSSQAVSVQKQRRLGEICRALPWGAVWISPAFYENAVAEIDLRCLSDILTHVSGYEFGPRFDSLEKSLTKCRMILHQNRSGTEQSESPHRDMVFQGGYTLHGCYLQPYKKGVLCYREASAIPNDMISLMQITQDTDKDIEINWDQRFYVRLSASLLWRYALTIGRYDPKKPISSALKKDFHQKFRDFPKKILATLPILYQQEQLIGYPSPDKNIFIIETEAGKITEENFYWRYDPPHKLGQS